MKKTLFAFFALFLGSSLYAELSPLKQDWHENILLPYNGINHRKVNAYDFQSKGLNDIIGIKGTLYLTSVNHDNKIVIMKISGAKVYDFVVTDIEASKYDNMYTGAGAVCADDNSNIYFAHINPDKSVSVSKIHLPAGKTPEWNVTISLNSGAAYLPLDLFLYGDYIYALICENKKNYYVIKISRDGSYKTITPPLLSFVGTKVNFNTLAAADGYLYLYGSYDGKMFASKYNLAGTFQASHRSEGSVWVGSVTRSSAYDDKYIYFLYQYRDHLLKHRLMRTKNDKKYEITWYKDIFGFNINSIHATSNGIFVGYTSGAKTGFQRYDSSGNLKEEKFIVYPVNPLHSVVYCDNTTLYILSSLENGDALFSSLPAGAGDMHVYNPDGNQYKDFAVTPNTSVSSNETFTYRIKYVNYKNEKPDSGYPRLYVYKNGALLNVNGYIMQEEDSNDTNCTDGKIYKYTLNLDMNSGTAYSYSIVVSCKNEQFNSERYYAPMFGDAPRIIYFEGSSYIFPDTNNKFVTTSLSAKMKFFEPGGFGVDTGYPVLTIYGEGSSIVLDTVMNSLGDNSYSYEIGTLPAGRYTYTIEAQNEYTVSAAPASGMFEILPYAQSDIPRILYFEGSSHIYPNSDKYADTALYAKIKINDPNNYLLSDGYPVLSIFDLRSGAIIRSVQMNALSNRMYLYNIGVLPPGNYKYKIEAKNEVNIEAVPAEGTFEILDPVNNISFKKTFNAPNPFNPARGESTKIVFKAKGSENVKIKIYTLTGDKVFEDNYQAVAGTNEYEYKGKDNSGRILYNGVYLCIVEKPSGNGKFKMLIIK